MRWTVAQVLEYEWRRHSQANRPEHEPRTVEHHNILGGMGTAWSTVGPDAAGQGQHTIKTPYKRRTAARRGLQAGDSATKAWMRSRGLPEPVTEYKFHPTRKWRFDYAWPEQKVALEVEGGVFTRQAHGSVSGVLRDIEKYNNAVVLGWRVLRVLPHKVCTDDTWLMLAATLAVKTI